MDGAAPQHILMVEIPTIRIEVAENAFVRMDLLGFRSVRSPAVHEGGRVSPVVQVTPTIAFGCMGSVLAPRNFVP
jgi:hypothetical protein